MVHLWVEQERRVIVFENESCNAVTVSGGIDHKYATVIYFSEDVPNVRFKLTNRIQVLN